MEYEYTEKDLQDKFTTYFRQRKEKLKMPIILFCSKELKTMNDADKAAWIFNI